MEQFGTCSRAEGVQACLESAFEFIWTHRLRLRCPTVTARARVGALSSARTIRPMSTRVRWTVVGGALLVVLGLVALLVLNYPREQRGPKTWVVEPGETLTLSADEVHPDDLYRCPRKGGVKGTPPPGHGVAHSGGLSVETDVDGTVTAQCEPGPPGNV